MSTISRNLKQLSLLVALVAVLMPAVAMAARVFYPVDGSIRTGMLVSLTKNPEVVEPATDKNMSALVGVVGGAQSNNNAQSEQVNVQTDGVVNTLVSTIGGDIKVGDHISPSVVVGFGAKSDGTSWIVGTAQASLNAGTNGAVKSSVTDSKGVKREVYLATIPVVVKVLQENASAKSEGEQSSRLPNKIQTFADAAAGKKASQVAVILSFVTFMAGLIIAGVIVNTAVKNGIIATARQPFAKQAIMRRMTQSALIAMGILTSTIIASLAILRIL